MADYSGAYETPTPPDKETLYRRENPRVVRYIENGWAILETVVHEDYSGNVYIPGHGTFEVKAQRRDSQRGLTYTIVKKTLDDPPKWSTGT